MIYNIVIEYAAFPSFFLSRQVQDGLELSPFVSFELFSYTSNRDTILESVFDFLNKVAGDWSEYPFYSLSVKDRVYINGQGYECKPVGWEKIEEEL